MEAGEPDASCLRDESVERRDWLGAHGWRRALPVRYQDQVSLAVVVFVCARRMTGGNDGGCWDATGVRSGRLR